MAIHYGGRYTSVDQITGPSGFYNIKLGNDNVVVYVDQEYDGGGWVCVLANRQSTNGMTNLTYNNAINTCNYRTGAGSSVAELHNLSGLSNYNIWIGLRFWELLGKRKESGLVNVVQFVSNTNGDTLTSGTHTKRFLWKFEGFTSSYSFRSPQEVGLEVGDVRPGLYTYHVSNGFNLTTYDNDQDIYGTNCSNLYNNNPYWYGNCWDGNFFAGGSGYADAPYWSGSGGDYHRYGAIYIK